MAPRKNRSDKQRRVAGVITVIVIAAIILIPTLTKKNAAPATQSSVAVSAPAAATSATTAAPSQTPAVTSTAPAVEAPATPAAPVVETVAAPAPVEEASVVEAAPAEAPVVEPVVEAAVEETPVAETTVAEEAPVAEVAVVEEPTVVEAAPVEGPLFAEAYTYMGYNATATAYADNAILTCDAPITAADVETVAALLVEAYPEASYVTYELGEGSLTAYYPECDAEYLEVVAKQLQEDALWYLSQLFAAAPAEEPAVAVEETAPVAAPVEEAPAVEYETVLVSNAKYAFSIYGYGVGGEYAPEYFDSYSETKGLLSEEDILGFVSYEVEKYGAALADITIEVVEDGFVLTIPAEIDAADYIDAYAADIVEYLAKVFGVEAGSVEVTITAPVYEEVAVAAPAEEAVEEAVEAKASYSFEIYGYGVSGEYAPEYFDSYSETKGLLSEEDILGFVSYEVEKYGAALDGVVIAIEEDGFVLAIPAGIDVADYIEAYQAEIIEYVNTLLAVPTVEAPIAEAVEAAPEAPVEAPVEAPEAEVAVETPVAEAPAPVEEAAPAVPAPIDAVEVVVVTSDTPETTAPAAPATPAAPAVAPVAAETKAGRKVRVAAGASVGYAVNSVVGQDIIPGGRLELELGKSFAIGAKAGYGVLKEQLVAEGFIKCQIPGQQAYLYVGGGIFGESYVAEVGAGTEIAINNHLALFGEAGVTFSKDNLTLPTTTITVGTKVVF